MSSVKIEGSVTPQFYYVHRYPVHHTSRRVMPVALCPMSSSSPYQSRLLRRVLSQFQQGMARQRQLWQKTKSAVRLGAQATLYPVYVLLRTTPKKGPQIGGGPRGFLRRLLGGGSAKRQSEQPSEQYSEHQAWSDAWSSGAEVESSGLASTSTGSLATDAVTADQPIIQALTLVRQWQLPSQGGSLVRRLRGWLRLETPETPAVRGIAMDLESRALQLIDPDNQIAIALTPLQEQRLQDQILALIEAYWQQATATSALPSGTVRSALLGTSSSGTSGLVVSSTGSLATGAPLTADQPIIEALSLVRRQLPPQGKSLVRRLRGWLRLESPSPSEALAVRGIAMDLESRSLQLIDGENQIAIDLSPIQEQRLQDQILALIEAYWQQATETSALPNGASNGTAQSALLSTLGLVVSPRSSLAIGTPLTVDQPIIEALSLVRRLPPQGKKSLVSRLRGWLRLESSSPLEALAVRGIAMDIESRVLQLIDGENQIAIDLTPLQEQRLQDQILALIEAYWQQATATSALPNGTHNGSAQPAILGTSGLGTPGLVVSPRSPLATGATLTADQPIVEALSFVRRQLPPQGKSLVSRLRGWLRLDAQSSLDASTALAVRGIAMDLESRSLQLIDGENQIAVDLTPLQEQRLQDQILALIEAYWQRTTATSALPNGPGVYDATALPEGAKQKTLTGKLPFLLAPWSFLARRGGASVDVSAADEELATAFTGPSSTTASEDMITDNRATDMAVKRSRAAAGALPESFTWESRVVSSAYILHPLERLLRWVDILLSWVEKRWDSLMRWFGRRFSASR